MYGLFTYMWLISMVNVGKYTTPMDPMGWKISKLTQLFEFSKRWSFSPKKTPRWPSRGSKPPWPTAFSKNTLGSGSSGFLLGERLKDSLQKRVRPQKTIVIPWKSNHHVFYSKAYHLPKGMVVDFQGIDRVITYNPDQYTQLGEITLSETYGHFRRCIVRVVYTTLFITSRGPNL